MIMKCESDKWQPHLMLLPSIVFNMVWKECMPLWLGILMRMAVKIKTMCVNYLVVVVGDPLLLMSLLDHLVSLILLIVMNN